MGERLFDVAEANDANIGMCVKEYYAQTFEGTVRKTVQEFKNYWNSTAIMVSNHETKEVRFFNKEEIKSIVC